jgi:4-hydroxy-tetrahydrodipicolinate synthase
MTVINKIPKPLKGIIPPMITPLLDNKTLDLEGLNRLIEHILAGGVHGLFILGTTGELSSLDYNLRHEFVSLTCKIVDGRVPVLVGITDTAIQESINLAQTATSCNASAVVAAPPYYYTPTSDDLISYYRNLADQLPLPLFLYNMPSHTKVSIEPSVVKILAEHPNIVGLKDSSANGTYFQQLLYTMKDDPDFSILIGPEELTAEAILMGAHGGVNGGANMFPRLYVDLYEASVSKDFNRITALQENVMLVASRFYTLGYGSSSYLKGLKCALSLMGICKGFIAEPFKSFGAEERKLIKKYLKEMNVVTKDLEMY